jgi:myo-inositol-1(or 4)-monophosphatase
MTDHDLDLKLLVAAAAIREAGHFARRFFERRAELAIELKGAQDLVSIADREVEQLLRARLAAAFPEDGLIGEEGEAAGPAGAEGCWVIDPIDGTMNFLRGVPYWSVVVAFVVGGRTVIGLTYDPVHDELFAARRGGGAFRNGEPIRVSGTTDPGQAVIGHTFSFKTEVAPYVRTLANLLEAGVDHRRLGSTALMLCHVADGRLDGVVTLRASSWDVIAGLILVREAGGVTREFLDHAGLTEPGSAYACTPALAAVIEEASGLRAR